MHQTGDDGRVDSDHPGHMMGTGLYTRASLHSAFIVAIAAIIGTGLAALFGRDRPKGVPSAFDRFVGSLRF